MRWIWTEIEKRVTDRLVKQKLFLICNTLFFSLIGSFLWLITDLMFSIDWTWGVCLVGYPGFFIGYIGGIFYLLNH